jgi:hypothetical protein
MNKHSFIVGQSFVNLTNTETGNSVTITEGDSNFKIAIDMIRAEKFDELELLLDKKVAVAANIVETGSTNDIKVSFENGQVVYRYKGASPVPLSNAIVDRIISMSADGFNIKPMCMFLENLLSNPSQTAINELYLFLEACKLPITEDGYFIAYKIVHSDYMDIYSKTMDNSVGKVLEMPRFEVDANRNNTCSRGLHFCSKAYLSSYGSGSKAEDRAMLVKINPADVVSIPSDYNNAKGRAWRYEVVGEVPAGWRATLPQVDYTASSVVDTFGNDFADSYDDNYFFNAVTQRWQDSDGGRMVSRAKVMQERGCTLEELKEMEE